MPEVVIANEMPGRMNAEITYSAIAIRTNPISTGESNEPKSRFIPRMERTDEIRFASIEVVQLARI